MGRISIKGGVWTNAEDEILKASVMKYGKNQWARIASLLHKKSAKQCKARWLEWLDPSIKKTEWSKEEDEKLLHMAKLMPTQWRTIAPIVGRTAHQCFERYEYLLDKAQNNLDANIIKTKNELESNPEYKPARPDPVDMDEDEMEMLSEARARLANTQGKKAKRKARERQLQDARRLAALQKTRELKAAGIIVKEKHRRGKRVIDYNQEIPFEKQPLRGLFDTASEVFKPAPYDFNSLRQYDLDTQRKISDKRDAQDIERAKKRREMGVPPLFRSQQLAKRKKLDLPAPQVTDQQLDEIVKFGNLAESSRALSDTNCELTNLLIADGGTTPMMTPRTPMQAGDDSVLREARNILALSNVSTPLVGGTNTPLSQVLPPASVQTPNTVLTPHLAESPRANPDEINIDDKSGFGRKELAKAFHSLPRPQNECELAIAGLTEDVKGAGTPDAPGRTQDREDIEAAEVERAREEARCRFALRSQVIQRGLPRPSVINRGVLRDVDNADELIKREMLRMLEYDALHDPVDGGARGGAMAGYEQFSGEEMANAKLLIAEEMAGMGGVSLEEFGRAWEECHAQIVYHPADRAYARLGLLGDHDKIACYRHKFEKLRESLERDCERAERVENRLGILLGGYQSRAQSLTSEMGRISGEIEAVRMEIATFGRLREREAASAACRVSSLRAEVASQLERERDLQGTYRRLLSRSNGV